MKLGIILQVAVTYVGAVIGAGFASGQEILQFFVIYFENGIIGIIIAGLLFAVLGIIIIYISYQLKVVSYQQLFYNIGIKGLGRIADLFLTLFLLGSLIVMLAGSKQIFNQFFGINSSLGIISTLVIIVVTNYYGLNGIMKLNTILIPILMFVIIIVISSLMIDFKVNINEISMKMNWLFSALNYTGYNLVLSLTILIPLTAKIEKNNLVLGVGCGGLLLGIIAFLIGSTLEQFYSIICNSEIPMLDIVLKYNYKLYSVYALTLWLAMITTASCNLYGVIIRFEELFKLSKLKNLGLIIIFITPVAQFPFSYLIEIIYPQLGKISLILLILLIVNYYLCNLLNKYANR